MLKTLIFIPLLGILHMQFLDRNKNKVSLSTISPVNVNKEVALSKQGDLKQEAFNIKHIALIYTILTFFWSLTIWLKFDSSELGFQFIENVLPFSLNTTSYSHGNSDFSNQTMLSFFYDFNLGLDGLSLYFVLLTCFTMPIMVLCNWNSLSPKLKSAEENHESIKSYFMIVLLLESLLLSSFLVLDLILFYIFFESILPPLFILIKLYGAKGKVKASMHLFLYTLLGSLFMLLAFLTLFSITKTTDFSKLSDLSIDYELQKILWMLVFISIMVKSPLWPFTLWLKLAHAEAPLGGSVLLAGVILKLALYAVFRILLRIFPEASLYYSPFIYSLCIITIIYVSLSTLRQIDLKVIIALSSISHLAVCILAAFSNEMLGLSGAILLGICHGFVSPGLFILLGGTLYDRYHTRTLFYYRGLSQFMPLFSLFLFIFILGNMGTPLTGNFIGEFMSLSGSFLRSPLAGSLASLSIFLSAAFSVYLYNRICAGIKSPYLMTSFDLNRREFYLLLPLLVLTIVVGIYPKFILENLNYSLSGFIYSLV